MAGSSTNSSQQVLEAMSYFYGIEECRTTLFVDDVSGSLDGEYYELNGISEDYTEKEYYVWLDNGLSTDPALAGKTGIQVTYTDNDTAATIAGLAQVAIDAIAEFNATVVGATLSTNNKFLGLITVEDQSNAPAFTFTQVVAGFGGSLGAAEVGGAELSSSEEVVDVMSDQTGAVVLDQISRGLSVEISVTLKEMTDARWSSLVGNISGGIETGNNLVGYGTSKLYLSKFQFSGKLVMHPIRLAFSDRSNDIVIHKTAAQMNSINYSGEDTQSAEFSFTAYRDTSKASEVDLMVRGDYTLL